MTEGLDHAGAQAVIVALPAMLHRASILAALERGLHVLTEKSLGMTMAEARDLVAAARHVPGVVLMVDQNYRWRPHTRALQAAARDGRLGRVASVSYECRQTVTRPTVDAWREDMPHPYLCDVAIHHFDLLRACTGLECATVLARGVRPAWSWYRGVPGVDALLMLEDQVNVSYTGTMVARGLVTPQEGIVTVVGEQGTLRLEADSQVRWFATGGAFETLPVPDMPATDTRYALGEFLAAIRNRRRPETHIEDNIRSLAVMEATTRAVETGDRVAVAPLVAHALHG